MMSSVKNIPTLKKIFTALNCKIGKRTILKSITKNIFSK